MPLDHAAGGKPVLFSSSSLSTGGVLALDLSGTVGWAYGMPHDRVPATGDWDLEHEGGAGALLASFQNILMKYMELWQPSKVVVESPLPPMAQTSMRSAEQQYGLHSVAKIEAWHGYAAFIRIDALTARSEVMGSRRMSKDIVKREVMLFCRRRGIRAASHHSADAAVVWLWNMQRMLGIAPCAGPLWTLQ